ncbi:glycosyltransferase family 4 protein [Pedobacter endophyticus]|uniref:Glycosyltransferase family 4 protein n=1 Tax=Pedobacter endophyticus TaxID=2789740 RepID=A0A7U3Q4K4_9SPHI|nr:glycosyltransferase family 1 protein [Pedobacter endophyticus]QPH38357.1 glycosyltransferase family 4 protein [Pedobacter endophyticus]
MKQQQKIIVIDCRMISMSGIGTYLQHIIPGIIKSKKFTVHCLGYSELANYEWADKVTVKLMKAKILSIAEQLELPFAIPKCDIFWSPNWNVPLLPIKAVSRLATIHDVYHLANAEKFSPVLIMMVKIFMKRLAIYPKLVTVSEFSKREICRLTNVPTAKIEVIPLAPKEVQISTVRSGLATNYILYVGNVKPHKNLRLALEAFQRLSQEELSFVIVGKRDGFITNDTSFGDLIKELGAKIKFTGIVDDDRLAEYYKNATLFLFPSLYEGFGLPILEAMEANIPIIASNAASIPEVGGELVHYFDPTDVNDLLRKLRLFFDGQLKDLTGGYPMHLKNFSWQKAINSHIKILETI